MQTAAVPVPESDRLEALDVLRGFAVLGILVMNIQLFTMPFAAYFNPYALGQPSVSDLTIWSISHVLADQKFMTIFSLLFGAGVLLMTTRAAERGASAARLHYRRMTWLLVFGLAHAYLLWHGDILVLYAVCGMVVYPARRCGARTLAAIGVGTLAIGSAIMVAGGLTMDSWPAEAVADWRRFWSPPADEIAAEITAFQGGWTAQQPWRALFSRVPRPGHPDLGPLACGRTDAARHGAAQMGRRHRQPHARVLCAAGGDRSRGRPLARGVGAVAASRDGLEHA